MVAPPLRDVTRPSEMIHLTMVEERFLLLVTLVGTSDVAGMLSRLKAASAIRGAAYVVDTQDDGGIVAIEIKARCTSTISSLPSSASKLLEQVLQDLVGPNIIMQIF